MSQNASRPGADMVRRTSRRDYRRGRAPVEYERTILGGRPIDERTATARLFRSLEDALHAELGGRTELSVQQLALCRRAAALGAGRLGLGLRRLHGLARVGGPLE